MGRNNHLQPSRKALEAINNYKDELYDFKDKDLADIWSNMEWGNSLSQDALNLIILMGEEGEIPAHGSYRDDFYHSNSGELYTPEPYSMKTEWGSRFLTSTGPYSNDDYSTDTASKLLSVIDTLLPDDLSERKEKSVRNNYKWRCRTEDLLKLHGDLEEVLRPDISDDQNIVEILESNPLISFNYLAKEKGVTKFTINNKKSLLRPKITKEYVEQIYS